MTNPLNVVLFLIYSANWIINRCSILRYPTWGFIWNHPLWCASAAYVPLSPAVFFLHKQKSAWKYIGPKMEAWPTVAWVLLMTSIADWLKTVQSRDFTMTDIILLHPSSRDMISLLTQCVFCVWAVCVNCIPRCVCLLVANQMGDWTNFCSPQLWFRRKHLNIYWRICQLQSVQATVCT